MAGKVEDVLAAERSAYDAAVLDPPRAGLKPQALAALVRRKPIRIVYVSCDPSTFARDARLLLENGYHLQDVQPVDMFPQTYHIEVVGAFVRLKGV